MKPRRRTIFLTLVSGALAVVAALASGRAIAQEPEKDLKVPAPPIPPGLQWFNSQPLTMEQLRGKVVLIDFWEYTCVNCIRTFPYLREWHEKYKEKGLVIIGVHTPEFKFAKKAANVEKGAKEFGLTWPLINDADFVVWRAYGNRYWPAKYLLDHEGNVRYYHFGEGGYGNTEAQIQRLLKLANPSVTLPPLGDVIRGTDKPGAVCYPVTPELYLGHERGTHEQTLANTEGYQPGKSVAYKDPGKWEDGMVYFSGRWQNNAEAMVSTRPSPKLQDYLAIKYHALEVNAVMRPESGKPVKVFVTHDGKPVGKQDKGGDIKYDPQGRSYLLVDQPKMYHIIKNAKFGQRTLKLAAADAGMGIYTFTFVSCEVAKDASK